jgi:hypothetical protein
MKYPRIRAFGAKKYTFAQTKKYTNEHSQKKTLHGSFVYLRICVKYLLKKSQPKVQTFACSFPPKKPHFHFFSPQQKEVQ